MSILKTFEKSEQKFQKIFQHLEVLMREKNNEGGRLGGQETIVECDETK